uniref:Uncharacterized protein n=1 Tax=Rhizophora mucronata TaxID=61149 RepID=A0A2P2N5F9_RHIMU
MTCPPAPRKRKALLLDKDNPLNKLTVTNTKLLASPELGTAFRPNFSEK